MRVTVIGTGSKGNATLLETKNCKILIDAGFACKTLINKLASKKLDLKNLDAILITHEHDDHVKGLDKIAKYTKALIYINENSYDYLLPSIKNNLNEKNIMFITDSVKYHIKDITFVAINAHHDTVNCYSYLFKEDNTNNSYCHITDTGFISEEYLDLISEFNTIFIESNHDIHLLENGPYHLYLQERIRSNHGHLSNVQCSRYLKKIYNEKIKNVILIHLSEKCNTKDIAVKEVSDIFNGNIPFNLYVSDQNIVLDTIYIGEDDV